VDGNEFLALVHTPLPPVFDAELVARLAERMHVLYCREMLKRGYQWRGTKEYLNGKGLSEFAARPGTGRSHETLVEWESLGKGEQDQNLDLARSIPLKLVRTGYVMVAKLDDSSAAFTDEDVELLAEEEHERWLWEKLRSGARYAPQRGAGGLEHPAMLPWRRLSAAEKVHRYKGYADRVGDGALSEEEKEKDRGLMQGIPEALLDEGYTIVKVAGEPERHAPRVNVTQGVIVQSFRGTSDRSRRPTT
jgi:hypothetical protein